MSCMFCQHYWQWVKDCPCTVPGQAGSTLAWGNERVVAPSAPAQMPPEPIWQSPGCQQDLSWLSLVSRGRLCSWGWPCGAGRCLQLGVWALAVMCAWDKPGRSHTAALFITWCILVLWSCWADGSGWGPHAEPHGDKSWSPGPCAEACTAPCMEP